MTFWHRHHAALFVTLLIAGCGTSGAINKALQKPITITYDEFDDSTTIKSRDFAMRGVSPGDALGHTVDGQFYAFCKGNVTTCENPTVYLSLTSRSETWLYHDFTDFTILVGEEKIEWKDPERDGDVGYGNVRESFFIRVLPDQLRTMAYATDLKSRLGVHELNWTWERREDARIFAEHLGLD